MNDKLGQFIDIINSRYGLLKGWIHKLGFIGNLIWEMVSK